MERCAVCGAEEFIPYVCRYCGRTHCVYHRLPENHECPNIAQARAPKPVITVNRRGSSSSIRLLKVQKLSGLSRRELTALIGALAVLGISFSLRFFDRNSATWNRVDSVTADLEIFLLTLVVVGTAFIGHELAHKFAAQRYGLWAEFKLWTYGALMALLFAVVTAGNFVFAAPGAVYIASRAGYFGEGIDRKSNGIVSLMGPILNIAGALVFGIVLLVVTSLGLHDLTVGGFRFLQAGIVINVWLGAFNMLPIFILDGQKVYTWNKQVWAAIAIPLWALTILIYASPPA